MTVQELLCDESKWTRGDFARDARDIPQPNGSPTAVKWCLYGAILKVCNDDQPRIKNLLAKLRNEIETVTSDIATFNDSPDTTFADIRRVIEAANI